MRRREFIILIGSAVVSQSLAVRAQRSGNQPTIGFLGTTTPKVFASWTTAFVQRLRELGWIEGDTVKIEYRWAEGHPERYAEIASEFVRLKVDLIFTTGAAISAAKQATSSIPLVFAVMGDPVGAGVVASLARRGGKVTGISVMAPDLGGKRLGLLHEVVPNFHRLGVLANVAYRPAASEMKEVQAKAGTLGMKVVTIEIQPGQDITAAIAALNGVVDALYAAPDPLVNGSAAQINTSALAARLPTMWAIRESVAAGGLMAYGPSYSEQFRRGAEYVDKILRGANPSDLPVEQPTKFDLVINLKTAKALGVVIPQTLLSTADEVIE
jgi:putative tryptophan/tyrosine transport system substrate-binding protein